MSRTIVGIFDNYSSAENAAKKIKENGLRTDDISILAKQDNDTANNNANFTNSSSATNDNISDGVVTGTVLGGLGGLLIGIGTVVVPGLGVIAAAGPIVGLLSGAVTGGVVGGLVDLGIPEDDSKKYESDIKSGKILLSMKCPDDNIDKLTAILRSSVHQKFKHIKTGISPFFSYI
jgi:uncharacterized membrane protein